MKVIEQYTIPFIGTIDIIKESATEEEHYILRYNGLHLRKYGNIMNARAGVQSRALQILIMYEKQLNFVKERLGNDFWNLAEFRSNIPEDSDG